MSVKKWFILCSIVILSTSAYAQKGVSKAVETAVERQVLSRAKLPTLRDGVRNLLTRRLGTISAAVQPQRPASGALTGPTRSVLLVGKNLPAAQVRPNPYAPWSSDYYNAAQPGSGDIAAIALHPKAVLKEVEKAQLMSTPDREQLWQVSSTLGQNFVFSNGSNWPVRMYLAEGKSFEQVHSQIENFRNQCTFSPQLNTVANRLQVALDVLDIQTWMLAHDGLFPQTLAGGVEASLAFKFEELLKNAAHDPEFVKDSFRQGALQHLVHLRATAKGAMSPFDVMREVLKRADKGLRIPGSSLVHVNVTEEKLTQELNYVELLRRANLLYLVVPMQRSQEVVELYLRDFQEKGRIYQQMIKIIPEFAADDQTLNVPTRSSTQWDEALRRWKEQRKARGLKQTPRSMIMGRFGLPLNFNDLTKEEQTEVLLGTYLRIK